ncbi:MAG: PP2C family protein-serine/threonine phosphatase [Akkermansiaceae bacterium]
MQTLVYVLAAVSCLLLAVLLLVLNRVSSRLSSIENERDSILGEEMRMFDFLHHLGSVIDKDISPVLLYKEIVEGLCEVIDATGGAMYILSEDGKNLIPKYITKNCPPLVGVPVEILKRSKNDSRAIDRHVRLSKLAADEGVLGSALSLGECMHIPSVKDHASFHDAFVRYEENLSALIAPLFHADRDLGVVAIVKKHADGVFSDNDFQVFKSVSEQSSFAMGNAMIHQELTEKRKIDDELRTAREVQNILLPNKEPSIPGYRVAGSNTPARMISGDYFDYMQMPDEKWGLVIADVTGKGVPAGLLMAMCRSLLRLTAQTTSSPSIALAQVNRNLFPDVREDMFVSLLCLTIDGEEGNIRLARAGHDPPLMFRSGTGAVEFIKPPGVALGIDEGDVFERVTKDMDLVMHSGDCLLLYTDGICEAVDDDDNEFGKERMEKEFIKSAPMGASVVVESLKKAVVDFAGDQPQMDDITMVAIEKR